MIHRYWGGKNAPLHEPWIGNAVRASTTDIVCDWTDEDLDPAVLAAADASGTQVDARDRWRHRANVVRWHLLADHGGVWLDHDVVPLVDLAKLTRPWTAALGAARIGCAIGAHPNSDLAAAMLGELAVPREGTRRSMDVSGDHVLTRVCATRSVGSVQLPYDGNGNVRPTHHTALVHLFAGG